MNPSSILISKVRACCAKAYVEMKHTLRSKETFLHGFRTRLFKAYHGGNALLKYLAGYDLSVVECGSQLLVVTTLDNFLEMAQQSEQHISPEPISLEPSELKEN